MGKTALLLMDMQVGIIGMCDPAKAKECLERAAAAANAARAAKYPVIYVTVEFRPGHPELGPHNLSAARAKEANAFVEGDASVAVHPVVAPQEGDIKVVKRRVSAFGGSDLDAVLRGLEVDSLVLGGVATSGVVLSTVRQAADMDFKLTVLEDLCLDRDEEVHRVLVQKVFPKQTTVKSSTEWIQEVVKA
ncbi:putative isochorismatase hydrolase protein [Favolaschia claudopus]|uniref:Isochorismatase hydrolase protein n=1 Tax=Favolaschia claudopus TaxID=2862362 RepID=A0AAW0DA55_9AGAR